jgi:putative membrane protein
MAVIVYAVLLLAGLTLLVLTVLRVLVGGLADSSGRPVRHRGPGGFARAILDERYAAGELSNEEYQHRLRVLGEEC